MSDDVLFQMWGPFRQSLIDGHLFYVEEAHKRLLSQFDNIETDADRAADEWLENRGLHFDPDRHDLGDFYEAAYEVRIEFFRLLSKMREQTRLSVVAGMFHEWDKQLRDWLAREIQHWHRGDKATLRVWSADFGQMADLLESFGWNVLSAGFFRSLEACRLVVNVYKHGEGKSLDDLRQAYPEYLDDPFKGSGGALSEAKHRNYTHLKVSDDQFQAFSDTIEEFWKGVPEKVLESQITAVPVWFEKAIAGDRGSPKQAGTK